MLTFKQNEGKPIGTIDFYSGKGEPVPALPAQLITSSFKTAQAVGGNNNWEAFNRDYIEKDWEATSRQLEGDDWLSVSHVGRRREEGDPAQF